MSSCSLSWPGPAVARSENRRFVTRRSRQRSLSASRAKHADARSTAVGRQSSIPVISVFLIPRRLRRDRSGNVTARAGTVTTGTLPGAQVRRAVEPGRRRRTRAPRRKAARCARCSWHQTPGSGVRSSMGERAECHIGGPDFLPGNPLPWVGRRDDVIAALVNGDVIDVAVGVGIHVEEYEVAAPCRALALAAETQELRLPRSGGLTCRSGGTRTGRGRCSQSLSWENYRRRCKEPFPMNDSTYAAVLWLNDNV